MKKCLTPEEFLAELKKKTVLDDKDDKFWKDWVDFKNREWRDLYDLIASDVRPEFKRRAIFILLAPDMTCIPFYFKQKFNHKYWCDRKFILNLDHELALFTAELVSGFCRLFIDFGENSKHIAPLDFYNHCIINLLHQIPDKNAEELLKLFQIDLLSEYVFFHYILKNDKVPFRWKKVVDSRMREIIKDEKEGRGSVTSKVRGESAVECYAEIIERLITKEDPLPYHFDLCVNQIGFIIDNSTDDEEFPLLSCSDLPTYLKLFGGDDCRALRLKIARYLILHKFEEFKICDSDILEASQRVFIEFGDSDRELFDVLSPAIKIGQESWIKRTQDAYNHKMKVLRILVGMS
jgi:hypothetical protein